MFGLPEKLNRVGYLVVAVTFVIAVTCYFIELMWLSPDQKEDVCKLKAHRVIHEDQTCSNYSTTFLPLPIVLMLFLPDNLIWIKFLVDGLTILITIAYNINVYLKSVKEKD